MEKQALIYQDDSGQAFHSAIFYPASMNGPRPGILVAPDWSGCNKLAHSNAQRLAELGYISMAVDLYGNGKTGTTIEEKQALMTPLKEDRGLLQQRMLLALNTLKKQKNVDPNATAAIGFCFGGLAVLDLARTGADILAVVSFHGILVSPTNLDNTEVPAKILVLHGYDDPMVPPEQVLEFGSEMVARRANWQLHAYGGVQHAFTNPEANDPVLGAIYDETAAKRSWQTMKSFLAEVFNNPEL